MKKLILTAENRGIGVAFTLNGVYKGTYFGRITPNTDANAMVKTWTRENGVRTRIIRTYVEENALGSTVYAELTR